MSHKAIRELVQIFISKVDNFFIVDLVKGFQFKGLSIPEYFKLMIHTALCK